MELFPPLTDKTSPCTRCGYYLFGWRGGGPDGFPSEDWNIIEKHEQEHGINTGFFVYYGKAQCKSCGFISDFFYYPDYKRGGYGFSPGIAI